MPLIGKQHVTSLYIYNPFNYSPQITLKGSTKQQRPKIKTISSTGHKGNFKAFLNFCWYKQVRDIAMEIFTFPAGIKQKDQSIRTRVVRFGLSTISEETDQEVWEKKLAHYEDISKDPLLTIENQGRCHHRKQNARQVVHRETEKDEDNFCEHSFDVPDHGSRLFVKKELKTSTLDDINSARVMFPDFFPRSPVHDCVEDSTGTAKFTIEQLYSRHSINFSRKSFAGENFGIEVWRKNQLLL